MKCMGENMEIVMHRKLKIYKYSADLHFSTRMAN
jgi:hypothetical protein